LSRRFRLGSIRLEKSSSSFWRSFLASRRVGSRNGEQPSSKFFSRHACAEGALQCCRGDGSSFSFSIEGAPHYRHCGKIILTRLDGPPSSFPPTHRPRDTAGGISDARPPDTHRGKRILTRLDGPPSSFPHTHRPRETPGGISDARPHYSRTALHLASLSTHDEPCGCTSLHFQPVTNTAAALRFTFNPGRTLRLRFASLSTHDEHRSLGWPRGRPRGWLRHACGMPAGDARGMPAACLRHACVLHACFRHSAGHACGLRRHSSAGIRFASPGQQNGENA
jgi:hypothetical protein